MDKTRSTTTQGKNERLHQTIQKFLDAHRPIRTHARLVEVFDTDGVLIGSVSHPGEVPSGTFKVLATRPGKPNPGETPPSTPH